MPPHGAKTRHAKPLSRQKERLDLSRIDEWDISLAFSDSKSVTSRLCIEVVRAFRSVLRRVKSRKDLPRSLSHRLDKSCGSLTLWAAGYGVREGELDDALAKSRSLRRSISELLLSIGKAVSEELIPRLGLGDDASVDVSSLRAATADASAALSEDRRRRNRASPGAKDDSSSSSSSSSSFSSGEEMYELDDATEDIANAVRCLLDLDSLIEAPAADQIQPEEHVNPSIEISCSPHQRFSERIAYRFPLAHGELVDRLARANLDRLQRTQMERRRNVLTKQEPEQSAVPSVVEVDQVSRTEGSTKFNDSGLGSSVRTASAYAETTMSYRQNESHSVRIPPLPAGAKLGVCFECMACNRTVSIRSNSAWKKHLYLDLKPWVCHDISWPGEKVTKDHPVYRNATPGPDGLWHCPWEGQASCNHKGALYKVNYDKYVHFHVSAYQCDFSSCEMFGFSSLEELSRHERNVHTMFAFGENQFPCSYDGCERSLMGDGFPRQRDLQDHLRRVHGDNGSGSSRTANAPVKESQPRPWKCPETGCKYHEYGWATEKELDRHRNDRHSMAPPMYECYFKPCPYKSKRESNCKQHMEKAHGWEYPITNHVPTRSPNHILRRGEHVFTSDGRHTPSIIPRKAIIPVAASGNRIARTMTDAPSDVATNTGLFGSYLSSDGLSDSDSFLSLDDDTRNLEPNDFLLFPRPTDAGDGPPPDDLPGAMSISPILNEGAAPPALPPPRHVPPVPSAPVIEPMQGSEEVDANEGAGITNDLGEAMGTPIGDDETPASARTGSSRPWQV
ncbi:Zinc finger transcription factor ace1 like protein [Verticillium longisporum]|nr:Zinc finger transcription factor ace1 like protein [Verticillium longisporum]